MSKTEVITDPEFAGLEIDAIKDNEIEQLAVQRLPIVLPWARQHVRLGDCYQSRLQSSGNPWVKETPFILADLYTNPKILDREHGSQATYKSVSTNKTSETGDHLSLGFGVGVGLPFLASVMVKGTYDKDVLENKDSEKQSIRSSVRAGSVVLKRAPRLTSQAMITLKYNGGYQAFCDRYGDYYVAGYRIGGETGILISASSFRSKKKEQYGVTVTLEVLFFEASKSWTKDFFESHAGRALKLLGYDTVDALSWNTSSTDAGVDGLRSQTVSLILRSQSILDRVESTLDDLHMLDSMELTNEQCDRLTEAGLVVELLLQPMSSLRDVKRWMLTEKDVI